MTSRTRSAIILLATIGFTAGHLAQFASAAPSKSSSSVSSSSSVKMPQPAPRATGGISQGKTVGSAKTAPSASPSTSASGKTISSPPIPSPAPAAAASSAAPASASVPPIPQERPALSGARPAMATAGSPLPQSAPRPASSPSTGKILGAAAVGAAAGGVAGAVIGHHLMNEGETGTTSTPSPASFIGPHLPAEATPAAPVPAAETTPTPEEASSNILSVAGGIALLAMVGMGGFLLGRRRSPAVSSPRIPPHFSPAESPSFSPSPEAEQLLHRQKDDLFKIIQQNNRQTGLSILERYTTPSMFQETKNALEKFTDDRETDVQSLISRVVDIDFQTTPPQGRISYKAVLLEKHETEPATITPIDETWVFEYHTPQWKLAGIEQNAAQNVA